MKSSFPLTIEFLSISHEPLLRPHIVLCNLVTIFRFLLSHKSSFIIILCFLRNILHFTIGRAKPHFALPEILHIDKSKSRCHAALFAGCWCYLHTCLLLCLDCCCFVPRCLFGCCFLLRCLGCSCCLLLCLGCSCCLLLCLRCCILLLLCLCCC